MDWIKLTRQYNLSGEELDGDGGYTIFNPNQLYHGKSYSDLASDWLNWFLSADADKRNSGQVVFLRSKGLPNEKTGANISDVPSLAGKGEPPESDFLAATDYTKPYVNDPNIRIGGDKLQIFEDQAVLIPIIVAFSLKMSPYTDWGNMQDLTGLTIDYGDNPPDVSQLTINGRDIDIPLLEEVASMDNHLVQSDALHRSSKTKKNRSKLEELLDKKREEERVIDEINALGKKLADTKSKRLPADEDEKKRILSLIRNKGVILNDLRRVKISLVRQMRLMESFRITTPIFTAVVPETQYGRSAKDFIEEAPVAAGNYPAMVDGYFILCKFTKGNYWIHSWASGPREARGPYFSELLYQIEVLERREPNMRVTRRRPSRNERIIRQTLDLKLKDRTDELNGVNELGPSERRRLETLLQRSLVQ